MSPAISHPFLFSKTVRALIIGRSSFMTKILSLRHLLSVPLLAALTGSALAGAQAAPPPEASLFSPAPAIDIEPFRQAAIDKWEKDIQILEAKDRTGQHPADSILFVGSSSIRLWSGIAADMAPYPVIQRGYGGAKFTDLVFFAERLIHPHTFRALVIFVGNDISGKEDDRTPAEVAALFRHVRGTVRKKVPTTPVFYVAVTPTPDRFAAWPKIRAANFAVRQVCESEPDTFFIGTESLYFKPDGTPDESLFRDDRLHQNQKGCDRWAVAIKSHLDSHVPKPDGKE